MSSSDSSFSSSLAASGAASVAPPAAAAPPAEGAAPEPPEGTEASFSEPDWISWRVCQSHVCVGASHLCACANFAESVSAYLVDVLALELLKEGREALLVGVNANRAEDGLNVLSRGGGVAGQAEEEVSCHVLHLDGVCRNALVGCGFGRVAAECSLTVGWFG
jgi:hypothetical protein